MRRLLSNCRRLLQLASDWTHGPGVILALILGVAGCASPQYPKAASQMPAQVEPITLREGDVLSIAFPGAPNLNTVQTIRRDGRITLPLVGEVTAAGMTPVELEKDLVNKYSSQLVDKEVTVTVQSSTFPVYVTGAVLHPGKIISDRPITALDAIMEAGGFDYTRANLKGVTVIRSVNGRMEHFKLNLKNVLEGNGNQSFNLKPSDIVYVPERFTWF